MYLAELKELGLTENEIAIYLLLLKNGALGPSEIASKANLHRGYVYDALGRMKEKKVVIQSLIKNKKVFEAEQPATILKILKEKVEKFNQILPQLESFAKQEGDATKVEHHLHEKLVRIVEQYAKKREKGELYITGLPKEYEVHLGKRKRKTIQGTKDEPIQILDANTLTIVVPGEEAERISIQNKKITQMFRKQFELLWRATTR